MSIEPVAAVGAASPAEAEAMLPDAPGAGAPGPGMAAAPGEVLAAGPGLVDGLADGLVDALAQARGVMTPGGEQVLAGAWAQAHAETAPWGNPADELAAGAQHRWLSDMARELARPTPPAAWPGVEGGAAPLGATPADTPARAGTGTEVLPAASLAPALFAELRTAEGPVARPVPEEPPRTRRQRGDDERRRSPGRAPAWDDDAPDAGAPAPSPAGPARPRDAEASPAPAVPVEDEDASCCTALWRALQRAADDPAAQPALQAAAQAWARGRAVLLACPCEERRAAPEFLDPPRGASLPPDPSTGWCFVLRRSAGAADGALAGRRFPARLSWARPAAEGGGQAVWHVSRLAKSFATRRGPQLVALEDAPRGGPADPVWRVACELQLGPVPAPTPRWREVLVRVDAARRLWSSLGGQWSLPLIVCRRPLLAGRSGELRR